MRIRDIGKSKSRLMKQRRRRQALRRFLPLKRGENIIHMTKGCRKVLNVWVKGRGKARKTAILNSLLTKRED